MSERVERMTRMLRQAFYERHEGEACIDLADKILLEVVAVELDDLESRIGSLKARPEDVKEWTDGAGVLGEEPTA